MCIHYLSSFGEYIFLVLYSLPHRKQTTTKMVANCGCTDLSGTYKQICKWMPTLLMTLATNEVCGQKQWMQHEYGVNSMCQQRVHVVCQCQLNGPHVSDVVGPMIKIPQKEFWYCKLFHVPTILYSKSKYFIPTICSIVSWGKQQ